MARSLKVAFHVNQFSFRGSEIASFDYAYYNVRLLNNISVIVANQNSINLSNKDVYKRFENEFEIILYKDIAELEGICKEEKIDCMYVLKYGTKDNIVLNSIPTLVHCVFSSKEPHGYVYAAVSESVALCEAPAWEGKNLNSIPIVNHMVYLPEEKERFTRRIKYT